MIPPLAGKQAFQTFLAQLEPKNGSREIWFKVGHNQFFVGDWDASGDFPLFRTTGEGAARRRTQSVGKAFEFLDRQSRIHPGGIFYIPTQPQGNPLKECVGSTDDIGIELDDGSRAEQLKRYWEFTKVTELEFSTLIGSGGKSVHAHLKADCHLPLEQAQYLRRLAVIALCSDPVTVEPHQPMRVPGFYRREKQKHQELISYSDRRYTYEQLVERFRKFFEFKGWKFPEAITDEWWSEVLRPIFPNHKGLTDDQKAQRVKEALEEGLEGYLHCKAEDRAKAQQRAEERKARVGFIGESNLVNLVEQTSDRLGSDAFDWPGHDWQWRGSKARGKCPFHESRSGTSAWIAQKNGKWYFHCYACTDNRGIDGFTYQRYLQQGFGSPHPEGKEYVEQAKQFLAENGVTHDDSSRNWGEPDDRQPDEQYQAEASDREQVERAQQAEREQERLNRFAAETAKIQAELSGNRFERTIVNGGKYISKGMLKLPEESGIVLVDAPMNSGKTASCFKDLLNQHGQQHGQGLEWLFAPRNLLCLQSGEILGLPHHSTRRSYEPLTRGSGCFESIGVVQFRSMDGRPIVLIDEPSPAFKQILEGKTCKDSQPFVIQQIREFFQWIREQQGWIVLAEDGVTNLEVDFVRDASGMEIVEHFHFNKTDFTPREYRVFRQPSMTWQEILARLDRGENLVIATDTQKWLEETERLCKEHGYEGIFIHGDNSGEPWAIECALNPDRYLAEKKPRVFGYTPTLQCGTSINDPDGWFSAVAIHLTHLEPRAAKQLPDRLRTDVPRFGYVKPRAANDDSLYSSSRPDLIKRDIRRNMDDVAKLTKFAQYAAEKAGEEIDLLEAMARVERDWNDRNTDLGFYLHYLACYRAREHYAKVNLRENLIQIWEEQGHYVTVIGGKNQDLAELRPVIRAVLDGEETERFITTSTADLTVRDARDIQNSNTADRDKKLKARKRLLEDKLPGCPLDNFDFVLKAIVENNGKFLKGAELLWLAQNPEAAKWLDKWNWLNNFSDSARTDRMLPIHRLSNRSAQAKLLNECPLEPFLSGKVTTWDNDTPEAIAVHQWSLLRSRQFARHLRLFVKEDHTPTQTVNKILRKFKYEVENVSRLGSRGDRQKQYQIMNLHDQDREQILASLSEKFGTTYTTREGQPDQAVSPTCIEDLPPYDLGTQAPKQVNFSPGMRVKDREQGRLATIEAIEIENWGDEIVHYARLKGETYGGSWRFDELEAVA